MDDYSKREIERWKQKRQAEALQDRDDRMARKRQEEAQRNQERMLRRLERERAKPEGGYKRRSSSGGISLGWILILIVVGGVAWFMGRGVRDEDVASTPAAIETDASSGDMSETTTYAPTDEDRASPKVSELAPAKEVEPIDSAPSQPRDSDPSGVEQAQQQAVTVAFQSGNPERWESGELGGYAVPSELVGGCRNVTISTDFDEMKARTVKKC